MEQVEKTHCTAALTLLTQQALTVEHMREGGDSEEKCVTKCLFTALLTPKPSLWAESCLLTGSVTSDARAIRELSYRQGSSYLGARVHRQPPESRDAQAFPELRIPLALQRFALCTRSNQPAFEPRISVCFLSHWISRQVALPRV